MRLFTRKSKWDRLMDVAAAILHALTAPLTAEIKDISIRPLRD